MKAQTLLAFKSPLTAPVPTFWNTPLADWHSELVTLLPRVARRLATRLERLPLRGMLTMRAMLWDYLNFVRPGSDASLLHGASEFELELIGDTLARQVAEAAGDEADASGFATSRDVANMITNWSEQQGADEFLQGWIHLSSAAGATPADFLRVQQHH